jgi:hypothetical protein
MNVDEHIMEFVRTVLQYDDLNELVDTSSYKLKGLAKQILDDHSHPDILDQFLRAIGEHLGRRLNEYLVNKVLGVFLLYALSVYSHEKIAQLVLQKEKDRFYPVLWDVDPLNKAINAYLCRIEPTLGNYHGMISIITRFDRVEYTEEDIDRFFKYFNRINSEPQIEDDEEIYM